MISVQIISTIIGGAKLALSVAQYLDSKKPNWRTEQICVQLDAIRDVHLKAGYQFLKDAALSITDESCKKCVELAYSEFVLASRSYPIDIKENLKNFELYMEFGHVQPTNWFERKIFNDQLKRYYGIDDVDSFIQKIKYFENSVPSLIDSFEGLALSNMLLNEIGRAKEALINLLTLRTEIINFMTDIIARKRVGYLKPLEILAKEMDECQEIGRGIHCISPETDLHSVPGYTKLIEFKEKLNSIGF